jgi:c(7)-type cytochrome triheme protein
MLIEKIRPPAVLATLAVFMLSVATSAQLDAQTTTALPAQVTPATQSQEPPKKKKRPSAANSFNRLLKRPAAASNAPPSEDGIHDPANPGTELLQWPSEAFQDLPKTNDGNLVDWLVIVREVKGSMPDVVYPHQQHTEWLDCNNCHDEIFTPEKGANQMSMAGILLGQKCGVCHGKVAFPVSDCRRCHARPKTKEQLRDLAEKSAWHKKGSGQTN